MPRIDPKKRSDYSTDRQTDRQSANRQISDLGRSLLDFLPASPGKGGDKLASFSPFFDRWASS